MLRLWRSRRHNTTISELSKDAFIRYAIHNNRAVLNAIVTGNPVKAARLSQRFDDDAAKVERRG